jgi:hypothetical protein
MALVGNLMSYLRAKLETKSVTPDTAFRFNSKEDFGHCKKRACARALLLVSLWLGSVSENVGRSLGYAGSGGLSFHLFYDQWVCWLGRLGAKPRRLLDKENAWPVPG